MCVWVACHAPRYVIEVNRSPSYGASSKLDRRIKFNLLKSTFQMLNLQPWKRERARYATAVLPDPHLLSFLPPSLPAFW